MFLPLVGKTHRRVHGAAIAIASLGFLFCTTAIAHATPVTSYGSGALSVYSFETNSLTSSLDSRVNVCTRNILIADKELAVDGTGLNLEIGLAYNSRKAANDYGSSITDPAHLGVGWTSAGSSYLEWANSAGDVAMHGVDGSIQIFQADGSWN